MVQIGVGHGHMHEMAVLGQRLQFHHAHGRRRAVALSDDLVEGVGGADHERVALDEAVLLPDAEVEAGGRIVVGPSVATGGEPDETADGVGRADEIVQIQDGPHVQEGVLMARDAREHVRSGPAATIGLAVELDSLADHGRLAELLGHLAQRGGGHRGDLFGPLRRHVLDMVTVDAKSGAAGDAVHLEIAFENRACALVVGLGRVANGIPVQRLVRALGPQYALGFRIHQRRRVGALDKEIAVDEVELVHEHVGYGRSRRRIGSGTDGHPQIGLLGTGGHVRVEVHQAQAVLGATAGELLGGHVEAVARGRAGLGAELDHVVDVVVVGHRVSVAGEQELRNVNARAADIGQRALSGTERTAQRQRAPDAAYKARHHGSAHVQARILGRRLAELLHDGVVSLVPGDLLPARILVEALFGVRPLEGLGDARGVVKLHDACRALRADMPAADRAVGIARQLHDDAVDHVRLDGAVVEAHVAGRGDPLPRVRIVGRLLRRRARQGRRLLRFRRTGRAPGQSGAHRCGRSSGHKCATTETHVGSAHVVPSHVAARRSGPYSHWLAAPFAGERWHCPTAQTEASRPRWQSPRRELRSERQSEIGWRDTSRRRPRRRKGGSPR